MTVEHINVVDQEDAKTSSSTSTSSGGIGKILELVQKANSDEKVSGILVQLPLEGAGADEEKRVVDSISVEKDVDGFHPENIGLLSSRIAKPYFTPCTPAGVIRLIDSTGFDLRGSHVVVIGRSDIVGTPVCALLRKRDATVTQCHRHTKNLAQVVSTADVLVVAIGAPGFVKGEWLKKGRHRHRCGNKLHI